MSASSSPSSSDWVRGLRALGDRNRHFETVRMCDEFNRRRTRGLETTDSPGRLGNVPMSLRRKDLPAADAAPPADIGPRTFEVPPSFG
nr:MAG TPA: hypothetical protein [Caudoviricetes sp.]